MFSKIILVAALISVVSSQDLGPCIGNVCPTGYNCVNSRCVGGTVSTTKSTACVDKVGPNGVSDCPNVARLCNNSIYYDLMTEQCPKTCGRCNRG
uniref:ShKT domain-containing protein n=1 Tax=Panagrellus redivivus TaxID=6233 RepID=A0A7E4V4X3_PANRE